MADVVATILDLPDDGGDPIIRIDYRLDSGPAVNSGLTAPFTGPFTIVDGSNKNVQWRAVNGVSNNPDNWSDIKTVASSAPTLQASDSLSGRTLTVTVDAVTGVPTPVVTISGNVAFVGPDGGPWTYTAPSSPDDVTVTWTVTAANGDEPDATVSGDEVIAGDGDFSVENIDDEIVIITDEDGDLTIEIEEGVYQGVYTTRWDGITLTAEMVRAAPTCFLRPEITGTPSEFATLTAIPGLWIYDGPDPGDQTWDWVNVPDGSTGETDLDYVVVTTDVGDRMKVTEAFAGIFVDSLETDVIDTGVPPYPDEFEVGDWTLATGSTGTPNSLLITIVSLPNDNGSPITSVSYDVDGDNVWRPLGIAAPGSEEVQMEFPSTASGIRLRSSNGSGASGPGDTKNATSGAGVPSVPVDWDPATGTGPAEIDIVITTLPEANGSPITDFEVEINGNDVWLSLGTAVVGTTTITMAAADTEYSFSLRAVNDVGVSAEASPEVAESGAGGGVIDPEAGLSVSNTWPEGASITVDAFVAGEPAVWAADFIGLDHTVGGSGLEVGGGQGSQGAGYYFTNDEFIILCGDGDRPTSGPDGQATLRVSGSDRPSGDGTLVVEYTGTTGTLPTIRAWWNGVRLTGVIKPATENSNWSAPSLGGWMNRSGLYPGDMPSNAMTYTSVSDLRQYNNQTVQDQPPVGDDPEDGLTLTATYAEFNNSIITAYNAVDDQVDVEAPAVMAFDITGLTTAEGYAYEFGATGIGAALYFDSVGDLVIRCGAGGSGFASSRTTALVIANADAPTGDGTLVVEFIGDDAGNLPRIRAWWDGTRLTGTDHLAFNDEQWAGTDPGGFMLDSGSHVSGLPAVPMTYTAVSDLRYYRNQTVNL